MGLLSSLCPDGGLLSREIQFGPWGNQIVTTYIYTVSFTPADVDKAGMSISICFVSAFCFHNLVQSQRRKRVLWTGGPWRLEPHRALRESQLLASPAVLSTNQVNSGFYIILLWLSALVSSFSNMYPEKPQFSINLSLGVCTSTSWLNIIRGGDEALLLSTDIGKTTAQVSIPTSPQALGLRSFMSLDNLSKPSYFHPSSKLPTHLAFKRSSCFLPFRKNTRTSGRTASLLYKCVFIWTSVLLLPCLKEKGVPAPVRG